MLDFMRDMFIDGDWADRLLGTLIAGVVILLMIVLFCCVFYLADSVGFERQSSISTLIRKSHTDSHTTTSYVMIGNILLPQTVYHSESWEFLLRLPDGRCGWLGVTEDTYNSHGLGDELDVLFKEGRLSDGVYIVDFDNER